MSDAVLKLDYTAILERLGDHGMVHRTVQLDTEGEYLPTDVDWNNKDVLHRNFVHSLINDIVCVAEHDLQASISFQKVLGVPFPLILVHYDTEPNHQTHFVTVMAWTMVTEHEFIALTPTRTRAVTTYTVAARPFWMLFWPAIRFLLRKNHRKLMSEDRVLRERRGKLRSWGYTYKGDGAPRDIRDTLHVGANNVVVPDPPMPAPVYPPIPVDEVVEGGWAYVGRNDHLGLKLTREGRKLLAFARMCPHEGADLDPLPIEGRCQVCPWHGRKLTPVAVLDLGDDEVSADTDRHHLAVADGMVRVTVTTVAPGALTSPGGAD